MNRVAITGFGVVSPIGSGAETFFDALGAGTVGLGPITRFDTTTFDARFAAEVKDLPPLAEREEEAARRDPKVGFALVAAREALAEAGLTGLEGALLHLGTSFEATDLDRIAVGGAGDHHALVRTWTNQSDAPLKIPLDLAPRLLVLAHGRPALSLTNCSACAAGAQAVGHGFRAVRSGRFPTAVCGGFDSLVDPIGVGGFQLLGALALRDRPDGRLCRPFDSERCGTVLGEGAAVVVLEPWERAKAEGKRILAEICGFGSTLDAHGLSAPDPDGEGAARAMGLALDDAGLEPGQIHHINAHGTGTRLNDEVEAAAIRRVFRGAWEDIPVSATKSATGHLIAAGGPVELGACLFALLRGVLPANVGLGSVGRGCELRHVTDPGEPWDGEYALSSTFGFGGQNAVLVIRRTDG